MQRSGKTLKISTTSSNVQKDDSPTPNGTSLVALLKQEEEEEEDSHHRRKKFSVLAKVKQRARKWRQTLNKKRNAPPPPPPPPGNSNTAFSWQTNFVDDDGRHAEDDAEIFRTPRHEFEREAEEPKKTTSSEQHVGGTSSCTMKDVLSKEYSDTNNEGRIICNVLDKLSMEAIASETESLGDLVPAAAAHRGPCEDGSNSDEGDSAIVEECVSSSSLREMKWGKGVSVIEYLVDKLRPGEEDRALCRAISDAIHPTSGEGGLVDKLRNTVTSLLLLNKEETPSSSSTNPDLTGGGKLIHSPTNPAG